MAALPDKVLNWLYTVLRSDYHDPNATYSDVARALATYPSLSPRTEVYTFENGSSALLLLLAGTVPVDFRGQTYRFPVAIWIPHPFPREGPIAFVTPSQDMLIRPGAHVSGEGRIYHPYLAQWARYWDKSSLNDFIAVLRGVFSKDPPVMSKQQAQQMAQQNLPAPPAPPPRPPPPEEYRRSIHAQSPPIQPRDEDRPPQLPPKGDRPPTNVQSPPPNSTPGPRDQPPPLPPLPQELQNNSFQPIPTWQHTIPGAQRYPPNQVRKNSVEIGSSQIPSPVSRAASYGRSHLHNEVQSPVSPIEPDPRTYRYSQQQLPPPQLPPAGPPHPSYQPQISIPHQIPAYPHNQPGQPQYQPPQPAAFQQPKPPPVDLLTSPLEVTLPSQTGSLEPLPAPPIPPNPEKDALLHAISHTLVAQTNRTLESNKNAIPPLLAQQNALRNAHAVLQAEIEQLTVLGAAIDTNERVLRTAMHEAEGVMRDAARRRRPEVDELIVCPTIVGNQMYNLVAEQKACEEARVSLAKGLDRGRILLEVYVRQTRNVAREEFLKKALLKKVSVGMGLAERRKYRG